MAKQTFKVIEVEKSKAPAFSEKEIAPFVARLKDDPGFQYLVAKLEIQRGALRQALEGTRYKSQIDFEFIQSGINWCGWLQQQVEAAVKIQSQPVARPARNYELDAFEALRANVELVGLNGDDNISGEVSPQG